MLFTIFFLAIFCTVSSSGHLDVLYKWQGVEFEYPNEAARDNHLRTRELVPGPYALPLDVDVWHSGNERFVFLAFPKFFKGVPVTLGTISPNKNYSSHLVRPYPDWSWHSPATCDGLTSVFRMQIDKCGRLWAIDSGMVDLTLPSRRRLCQPKLVAFNLASGQVAGKHVFPDSLLETVSLLTNVAVDVRGNGNNCQDTFAYVSDTMGFSLLVVDIRRNKSWNVESNSMFPYPPRGLFQTNNVEFNLMDGILGLALSPLERGERYLYYHSLASLRESWVATSVLRNEENFADGQNSAYRQFMTSEEGRKAQSAAEAFDRNGILYFGMVDNTLSCWNRKKPFTKENIHQLVKDDVNLQFASGMKVIMNEDGEEEIWFVTNKFQIVMVGSLDPNEINFRVVKGNLNELTKNSKCKENHSISFPNKTSSYGARPLEKPQNTGYNRFPNN